MSFLIRILCAVLIGAAPLAVTAGDLPRPDSHAPIGVMGDHIHSAGDVMLSYRYSRMSMDDNRSGSRRRSAAGIVANPPGRFVVAPTDMEMEMHMIGAMFAPHDRVTLAAMIPLTKLRMDHFRRDGLRFTTEASGLGDVQAAALVKLFDTGRHRAHLNAGLSFPTGAIHKKDNLPAPLGRQTLPYPMQIGSGTWGFIPGATYSGRHEDLSWGAQLLGTFRAGQNKRGYRLGDRADATTWVAYQWADWISTSARLAWSSWENLHGEDDRLNPNLVPTADPNRRGGHRLDWLLGANLAVPFGKAGNHRFAIEYGRAAYQWLQGPQLDTSWRLMLGWQSAFTWKVPGFGGSSGHDH